MTITFYALAIITIIAGIGIVVTNNILHAAYFLLFSLLGVAGVFVLAGADFLAVTQIMIYIGGILILILFGIMLEKKSNSKSGYINKASSAGSIIIVLCFFIFLFYTISEMKFSHVTWLQKSISTGLLVKGSTVEKLGVLLLTEQVLVFELAGLLLLVAVIGSTYIAGKLK